MLFFEFRKIPFNKIKITSEVIIGLRHNQVAFKALPEFVQGRRRIYFQGTTRDLVNDKWEALGPNSHFGS